MVLNSVSIWTRTDELVTKGASGVEAESAIERDKAMFMSFYAAARESLRDGQKFGSRISGQHAYPRAQAARWLAWFR